MNCMIETDRIECKEILTETLEKEVVAFLNYKQGGVIYLGIDKNGQTVGINDADSTQLKIKDRLKNNIEPACMGLFDIAVEEKESKHIIKIILASGSEKPYYLKKLGMSSRGCFVRIGSASEPMSTQMIEALFSRRTRNSIGKIRSHKQDLSFEQLKIYYQAKGYKLNDKFASNLELLTVDRDFNYVAYLMSDINGTSIKVAKYAGLDRINLIENNEYGYCSLIKSTKQVLEKLALENRTAALITSRERIEQKLWNPIALREAVINAIVHNDYSRELAPTFEIFEDRLEITSAGGLFMGINQEEFFKGYSNPVNREIMRIYKDLDMLEQLGSGMPRILSYYKKESFDFSKHFLRVTFKSNLAPITTQETTQETTKDKIVSLLKSNPKYTKQDLMKKLNKGDATIKQHLSNLKKEGILKRVGSTKAGYWEITK